MKKLTRIAKSILTMILAAIVIVNATASVYAAELTIRLGKAELLEGYVANVKFHIKKTEDGQEVYCLDLSKKTAQNIEVNLLKGSTRINGGLVHILKNGYPIKSFTNDAKKDYYITQAAVWWYLDETTGSTNLNDQFKYYGSDEHKLRPYIKKLVDEGLLHKNDTVSLADAELVISAVNGKEMTLNKDYYESSDIKATKINKVSSYTVTLENAPSGSVIVTSNGKVNEDASKIKIKAGETFKVKVPANSVAETNTKIKVIATAQSDTQYIAHEYISSDKDIQPIVLLESGKQNVKSELELEITSSKVTIEKIDSVTKKPLAGAKLVLRVANGKVISTWTTGINKHVFRNLANGTYTVEEIEAPEGYELSKEVVKFTITNKNKEATIQFENKPKSVVVNITKVDQETNTPLAGAELVLKDSAGSEIKRFTTTTESYIITDLKYGTYTVEEIKAPEGYIKSNEKIAFTIDEKHTSHQIVFVNAKAVYVPDTADEKSIIMLVLGIAITGLGVTYIIRNAKRI